MAVNQAGLMKYLLTVCLGLSCVMVFAQTSILSESQNWAGNQRYNPIETWAPRTQEKLIALIQKASAKNHKICVRSVGHSFSAITATDQYSLNTKNINKILFIDIDRMQVRAEGGILLNDFNREIAPHGLALPNLPDIGGMSLAGAVCTATHGTGNSGTLSSFITEIELIAADGTLHTLSAKHTPEAFKAACVNLGTLGVIYAITMQCEPLFELEYSEKKMSLRELLAHYTQFREETDYFQFRWQLNDDMVYADFWNRVSASAPTTPGTSKKVSYETLLFHTDTTPVIASEIAIPIDALPQAVIIIKDLVTTWTSRGLILPEALCRFVKADKNNYLSPTAYGDVVCINISSAPEEQYYPFFKEFEQALYAFQGRPHWGKINFLTHEMAHSLYGENLEKFIEIKHSLDPKNIFSNACVNQILGLK